MAMVGRKSPNSAAREIPNSSTLCWLACRPGSMDHTICLLCRQFLRLGAAMRAITARDFNQDTAGAKGDAQVEPVFILDRGHPSHMLIPIIHYNALLRSHANVADSLAMQGIEDVQFGLPPMSGSTALAAAFG